MYGRVSSYSLTPYSLRTCHIVSRDALRVKGLRPDMGIGSEASLFSEPILLVSDSDTSHPYRPIPSIPSVT